MIKYKCYGNHDISKKINVDELKVSERIYTPIKSSECPVCKSRGHVVAESQIYWCNTCRVPVYSDEKCDCCGGKVRKFAKDCRVVFPEEKLLLEIILNKPVGSLNEASVWNGSGNIFFVDGKRIAFSIAALKELDTDKIREKYYENEKNIDYSSFNEMIDRFVKANHKRFKETEEEAVSYIQKKMSGYRLDEMFISFSGGKDSTVVADLVSRVAAGNQGILHIYGDTTLEFPETYKYVEEYKKTYPKRLMFSSRNKEKDFSELCKLIGPPSRVMRWCCTIFKTGSLNRKIESLFKKNPRVLAFQGIRRSESVSRSKYDRDSYSSKIGKQEAAAPIIDWFDFDVWLYILTTGIIFNRAYRLGYTRVGCWCCPNNSTWSEFLSKIHMHEQYTEFRQMLIDFAKKVGKPDPEVYVDNGNWKARQGGNGLDFAKNSIVNYTPCVKEKDAFNYTLNRPVSDELYEFFKPFGKIDRYMGNSRLGEICILSENNVPIMRLQGRPGGVELKVIVEQPALLRVKNTDEAKRKIDCQITKYQMCIGCRACESVCRFGVIKVSGEQSNTLYQIDDKRCMKCQECVDHFTVGCYMRKVLAIKR